MLGAKINSLLDSEIRVSVDKSRDSTMEEGKALPSTQQAKVAVESQKSYVVAKDMFHEEFKALSDTLKALIADTVVNIDSNSNTTSASYIFE